MNDKANTITCNEHGESTAAFVCEHLIKNPVQRWYCNPPAEDDRWPDAWCEKCEQEFLKEGEWNEKSEKNVSIKLLCCGCYDSLKGSSVNRLTGDAEQEWIEFVSEAHHELHEKQELLSSELDLWKHKRWDWDQDNAELVFSNDGVPAVKCRIAFAGTVSTLSDTWLWSWANFSLTEHVRSPLTAVMEFGYEHDFPKLTVPKWKADEVDGWEMAAVAVKILNAKGAYRTPSGNGFTLLVILDAQRVQ